MTKNPNATRQRILDAADELLYGEGIRNVSVDTIAAKAGVTKRTLYYHFSSKDELIAAYLAARDQPTLERFRRWLDESEGPLALQVASLFRNLAIAVRDPRWKGCGFARAAAELAGTPGHPALAVASRHKKGVEAWLEGLARAEGIADAAAVARQLMVVLDGAVTQVLIHRDPSYAEAAGRAASTLLRAAQRSGPPAGAQRTETYAS